MRRIVVAVRWAALWAGAGVVLGALSLIDGGVGHLAGWMAPVVFGLVLGVAGFVGGFLFLLISGSWTPSLPIHAALGVACGAAAVWGVGLVPVVGIAGGGGWLLLLGGGLGLVGGLALESP